MRPDRQGRRNGTRGHELNRTTTVPHRRPPGRRLKIGRTLDRRLDGEVEGGRDETCPFSLLRDRPGLSFVARLSLEFESEQKAREAEAPVATFPGDPVAVDAQARVGEPCAGGEAGEGDGQARGCRGDEEVFGTPGGGVAGLEDRW